VAIQMGAIEFDQYTMLTEMELFRVAMPNKGNPELYGLRLIPINPDLPELFVWCYYSEEEKCYVHSLSDVWSGYRLISSKEYGGKVDLAKLDDWTWLGAALMLFEVEGKLQQVMKKRTKLPKLNRLSTEVVQ
jgi:hypothetical protein